ncbi:hypothetical protein [Bombella pollinis]|uniref:Uncharacterized protein n=1 Tax=Bombella pollinis TaxID=2967337 RepID=A0ABT3WNW7_9PROT|nr:hypothetical protein [Bombella pollinis]MCX5619909.1 hypothetical protein [Bombella pollinis]
MVWDLYKVASAAIMVWALAHLLFGKSIGIIGKLLFFLTAIEAGAICLPAPWHLPCPEAVLPVVAVTVIYQELRLAKRVKSLLDKKMGPSQKF